MRALNSITIEMVMGASALVLKLATCWGTLSSRIRKLPRGILGMKWPLLSSTATSSCTVLTSLWKVGKSTVSLSLSFLNCEGIFGSSASSLGASFFFGFATVSDDCVGGCPTATWKQSPASSDTTVKITAARRYFIRPIEELYQKVTYSRPGAFPATFLYLNPASPGLVAQTIVFCRLRAFLGNRVEKRWPVLLMDRRVARGTLLAEVDLKLLLGPLQLPVAIPVPDGCDYV